MAEVKTPFRNAYLVNQPDLVKTALVDRPNDFPKAEAVAVAQPKNVQGRYVRLSKTGIINLNELYVWKRDGTELVNLAAGKSVTGDNPEHESGNYPYHNLVDGACLPKLIHLLPKYGLTYWTVTDRPHPLRRHH